MSRHLASAIAILVLLAEAASAQVPGDSVSSGIGAAVANSRSRPVLGISHPVDTYRSDDDVAYQNSLKNIPNRKPAKDPWARIRNAPTASSVDRHKVE
jgi:hypothetical protein